MESQLERVMEQGMSSPNTTGCLFANMQGLCIGASGNASENSAGIIVAISEQASKLHPNANPPVILMDFGDKQCIINRYGITGAIYKSTKGK